MPQIMGYFLMNIKTFKFLIEEKMERPDLERWLLEEPKSVENFCENGLRFFNALNQSERRQFLIYLFYWEKESFISKLDNKDLFNFMMSLRLCSKSRLYLDVANKEIKEVHPFFFQRIASLFLNEEQKVQWVNNYGRKPTFPVLKFLKENEEWWNYYDIKKISNNYEVFLNKKDSFFEHLSAQIKKEKDHKTVEIFMNFLNNNKTVFLEKHASNIIIMTNVLTLNPNLLTTEEKTFCLKSYLDKFKRLQLDFIEMDDNDFLKKYPEKKTIIKRPAAVSYIEKFKKDLSYGAKKLFWWDSWLELRNSYKGEYKQILRDNKERPPIVSMDMFENTYNHDLIHEGKLIKILHELGFSISSNFSFLSRLGDNKYDVLKSCLFKENEEATIDNWFKKVKGLELFSRLNTLYKVFPIEEKAYLANTFPYAFTFKNIKSNKSNGAKDITCELIANYLYYANNDLTIDDEFKELLSLSFKK